MAQLVLTAASAVGSAVGKAGIGAMIARTAASVAASYVTAGLDRLIFGPRKRSVEGPRLESYTVQSSTEGAPILRVYGRARIAGQLIWSTNFKEVTDVSTQNSGGKGGGSSVETTVTEYRYTASFAVGLCEGVIDRISRVWADGKPLDTSGLTMRVYTGTENQPVDSLIEAVEGEAPAFRGLAYVVFEDMPLEDFGNRLPQLSFEVEKKVAQADPNALENALTAVSMIPASGEFVYGTTKVFRELAEGQTEPENVHNNSGDTDFTVSLAALQSAAPNLASVSLVTAWFGTDLDAGNCTIRPGVDASLKQTTPYDWQSGGVSRSGAHAISHIDEQAVYGGTPSDRAVIEAIGAMHDAGLEVMFHPFILMDIPPGNGLADPYGGAEQAAFPWRGRITVGNADKTSAAATKIASFFGTAAVTDFSTASGTVAYFGPAEWSLRRMILHYAHLCALAGGVEHFIIASELRGITTARANADSFPAVAALIQLAADVRQILGPQTKISYGADWSEYFGHQPSDGSGDVFFHLDPFWADSNVDFIGIDNYLPLADWRDGFAHLDALAGHRGPKDLDYLKANMEGGEYYDFYYASQVQRDAQIRTPIVDGAYGEDWVFRPKDLRNWWLNTHHDRPGGVRAVSATPWQPQSKPFIFTEAGCAAIDKGANQPNVFLDPKSSESFTPYFSNGERDDIAQRRFLEALHGYWREPGNNPVSSSYGEPMVDADHFYIYAWDARPYPFFPFNDQIWGDGGNWEKGHWLNGRLGRAPLSQLVCSLAAQTGLAVNADALEGLLTGYVVDRPLSPRETIDPLADVYQFDMLEDGNSLRFVPRDAAPVLDIDLDDLVSDDEHDFDITLTQEADLPAVFRLGFVDEAAGFSSAIAEAREPTVKAAPTPSRIIGSQISAVMDMADAEARARAILADAWVMREQLRCSLPRRYSGLEPGDTISLTIGTDVRRYRILSLLDGPSLRVEAVRVYAPVYRSPLGDQENTYQEVSQIYGSPIFEIMDLPLLVSTDEPAAPYVAAFADPWPGGIALYRQAGASATPVLAGQASLPAIMGRLQTALPPGAAGRRFNQSVHVSLHSGALSSRGVEDFLAGSNVAAVQTVNGDYEILQFENAVLQGDGTYLLSSLLRGQGGTEAAAAAGAPIGARFVYLNGAVIQPQLSLEQHGIALDWSAGPASLPQSDERFVSAAHTHTARAATPLSPVHLKAVPRSDGGFDLSWIRRTRLGGDGWEGEVPLGETTERYQVTIYDQGQSIRVLEVTAQQTTYDAVDVAADFPGGAPSILDFAVAQWSDLVGWGAQGRAM